jgi:hypothetical protein
MEHVICATAEAPDHLCAERLMSGLALRARLLMVRSERVIAPPASAQLERISARRLRQDDRWRVRRPEFRKVM